MIFKISTGPPDVQHTGHKRFDGSDFGFMLLVGVFFVINATFWGALCVCKSVTRYIESRNIATLAIVWIMAITIGVIASNQFFLPWRYATQGGTIYDVNASAFSWTSNETYSQYGLNLYVPICTSAFNIICFGMTFIWQEFTIFNRIRLSVK
jgi:hypothetical protein